MASDPIRNIVLVGRTGNGKSSTGNSIARQKVFTSTGVTTEYKTFRVATPDGPILNVIDTNGLFDLSVPADLMSKEIFRCLTLAKGELHAVLLVLSLRNRISKEEEMVLSTLQVIFGSKIVDYIIVVFTAGDVLEDDNITLDEYLGDVCPDFLKRVLILCGKRVVLFNNRTNDEARQAKQVHDLLTLIDMVRKQNNDIPFTDTMYRRIEEEIGKQKKEQEELRLTHEVKLKAMSDSMAQTLKAVIEAEQQRYGVKI